MYTHPTLLVDSVLIFPAVTAQSGRVIANLSFVLASSTLKVVAAEVGDGNQATEITDVDAVRVADLKQSLSEELCRTVSYLTVTLHLTKT